MTQPPSFGGGMSLPLAGWPEIDRRLWAEALRDDDPLDEPGLAACWATATREKRTYGYGRWLRFLQRESRLDYQIAPVARTHAHLAAYVDELRATLAPVSARTALEDLCAALRALQPMADLAWQRAVLARVKAMAGPAARPIQPRLVAARDLWRAGLAEMERAEAIAGGCRRYRAGAFRDGLAVALLAACPLRRRSFAGLEFGRHLVEAGDSHVLRLAPADLKNGSTLDFQLPAELEPGLRRYLDAHRAVLADRGAPTTRLWLNAGGAPIGHAGLGERVAKVTARHLGRPMPMHLFRHAAATSLAIEDPHHVQLVAAMLGHTRLATGERYYNMAGSLDAARSYQAKVKRLAKLELP